MSELANEILKAALPQIEPDQPFFTVKVIDPRK